ncbi:lipopolysaccharide biosynthesis [Hydrogenimonas sp.]|nr:lipopolysaccharide biosynthesis [Hydrogenimonas sp.]
MPYHSPEEDEIDLRRLWQTVVRRKAVLFGVTAFVMIAAVVYLLVTKPVYEAKALIQIGSINSKLFETPASLKSKLEMIYHVNDKNIEQEYPRIYSVSTPKKSEDLIGLSLYGLNNEEAIRMAREVYNSIVSKHRKIIDSFTELQKRHLAQVEAEAKRLKSEIGRQTELIESQKELMKQALQSGNREEAGLISAEYSKNLEKLFALQGLLSKTLERINTIELSLSPLNVKETRLVGDIVTYDHPVKPKVKLVLAVAFISGLMLGLFILFFMEFITKERGEAAPD